MNDYINIRQKTLNFTIIAARRISNGEQIDKLNTITICGLKPALGNSL